MKKKKSEVISKKVVKKDGKLVVTETVESTVTLSDLMSKKNSISAQKTSIIQQMETLKNQYSEWEEKEKEMNELIAQLGEALPEVE
jgi:hypothetical protein